MPKIEATASGRTVDGMRGEIGRMHVEISPEALKHIIASGRLLEFTTAVANQAAAHISSQIVEKIADMAVGGGGGGGVGAAIIFDGGDFGTVPPRPKFGVGPIPRLNSALQRVAAQGIEQAGVG